MRQSLTKSQTTNNLTSTGHHTLFDYGQNPTNKSICKGPKMNSLKLFIKDQNRPNLTEKRKIMNIKNIDNHWTTDSMAWISI